MSQRKVDDPRPDVAVDRDRIVHSHAFRRLQRKTQIVGASTEHDFFRTRLTHTIECAQTGRAITHRLRDDRWSEVVAKREHLVDLVEAVCLVHDLGHPPFGHTGEEALDEIMQRRFGVRFEGNAQSFRIVTLLEPKKYHGASDAQLRPLGLDLCRATLRAMSKYPWTERSPQCNVHLGKFGVYDMSEDLSYFEWMWDGDTSDAKRTYATDILEAADDIAYAVHDIEDGIWGALVPVEQLVHQEEWAIDRIVERVTIRSPKVFAAQDQIIAELDSIVTPIRDEGWARRPFDRSRISEAGLKSFCSMLTDDLISRVTEGGTLNWTENRELQQRIAVLKAVNWVWLIDQPEHVTRRYGQRKIIAELFEGFLDEPGMLPYQDEWRRVSDRGEVERGRFVCDHIASMTDAQAAHTHAEMSAT